MGAAFISYQDKALSSSQDFYLGVAILTGTLILIPFVIFRFEWLHRFWIFRAMFHWGNPSWGFPASRFGVISGCVLVLILGGMAIDHRFDFLKPRYWLFTLVIAICLLCVAARRDYFLYKRRKKPPDLRQRVNLLMEERTKMRAERRRRK